MLKLVKHLQDEHNYPVPGNNPEKLDKNRSYEQYIEFQVAHLRGLMRMEAFESDDALFNEQKEFNRAAIFRKMQKVHVTDQRLEERLQEVWESTQDEMLLHRHVLNLLKELRDKLEERTTHVVNQVN